jgi:hypothetical protein
MPEDIVRWIDENPIPHDQRRTPEEIDAWVAELRGDVE